MPDGSTPPDPEADIQHELARANLTNDPFARVLALVLRALREAKALIERAREPVPADAQERIGRAVASAAGRHLARLFPWVVAAACGVAFLAGAGTIGVAWWLSPVPTIAGPLPRDMAAALARTDADAAWGARREGQGGWVWVPMLAQGAMPPAR